MLDPAGMPDILKVLPIVCPPGNLDLRRRGRVAGEPAFAVGKEI